MSYTVSQAGLELRKEMEGVILHPYKDSTGKPTIGIGSTFYEDGSPVTMDDDPITLDRAYQLLQYFDSKFILPTLENNVTVDLNQNQVDALADFIYNEGKGAFLGSHLLEAINSGAGEDVVRAEFAKWVYVDHEVSDWQVKRRKRESDLYFS